MGTDAALAQGLEDGAAYGREHLSDRAHLGRITRAHTAGEVLESIGADLALADGVEDRVAYWSGFAHGVLRVLQETAGDPPLRTA